MTAGIRQSLDAYVQGGPQRAVAFIDLNSRAESFFHLPDAPLPSASVMKLPLAMALCDSGIDLNETIDATALTPTRYVSILKGFAPGHRLALREAAAFMLITSDNPLTVALTDRVGMDAVNALLERLGCAGRMRAGFTEPELGAPGRANVLTVRDCALLLQAVRDDDRYAPLRIPLVNNIGNSRIGALLDETVSVAHKTGTLNGVANDIAWIRGIDAHVEFILCLLTDGEPDLAAAGRAQAVLADQLYKLLLGETR